MKFKLILTLFFVSSLSLFGDALVSTQWLNQHKNDSNLRVILVGNEQKSFIPNSTATSIKEWRKKSGKHLVLRDQKEIEALIQRLGVNKDSKVVLYSTAKNRKSLLFSSYVYWALNVYGVKNVSILDGGLKAWVSEKLPTVSKSSQYPKSNYKAETDFSISINIDEVKRSIGKVTMLDARPHKQYFGLESSNGVKRLGHIKDAISYPWVYSIDDQFKVIDTKTLQSVFADGLKIQKDQNLIVYCTGGLETSFNFFVLHGVLGFKNVKLYDSSMKEWGNREDTPMDIFF
jgi:thiosulfate/3-mercaptopyruvate sulfurtransferase